MSQPEVQRGQIWLVDGSPGRGSEQQGRRPSLVIQTDAANRNSRYPNTIVLTLGTKGLPVVAHVEIAPDARNGLRTTCWVKSEQILTISKERLIEFWGNLSPKDLARVEMAVRAVLAL